MRQRTPGPMVKTGVHALQHAGTQYGPELCGAKGEIELSEVKKPSEESEFLTIGVEATPAVRSGSTESGR